jgi:pimeloyl-ACP methyl ester carboxylesterase
MPRSYEPTGSSDRANSWNDYFGAMHAPCYAAIALSCVAGATATGQQQLPAAGARMVDVDGHAMRVQAIGLDRRAAGTPVIVFEGGAGNALEVWNNVLPNVAAVAPVVAYDRAGLGQSAWDDQPPTPRHVVNRLRSLLDRIGAKPPYVLVGYSWGGILARYFAGYHPSEIAGLVLVDPGPMVTEPLAQRLAPFDSIGAGRAGFDAYWSRLGALFERAPPAMRAELKVFSGLMQRDSVDPEVRRVPNVPVVVIIAGKYRPLAAFQLPFDARAYFDVELRHRSNLLQEWVLASPGGTLVVSNTSTHAVPREDPELIVWAVKRVLAAASANPPNH